LLRPLPANLGAEGWRDAISPYGYSGALFHGGDRWCEAAVRAMVDACAARKILSILIRLHPLLPPPAAALDAAGVLVVHGETVPVDLTLSEEQLRANLRTDHRAGIRRLHREGFHAVTDDWSLYPRYIEIYGETMARLDASAGYRFPAEYFYGLRTALGPRLHLLSVIAPDGGVAAAGLFTGTRGIAQFHLSGTAERYRKQAPSKLMLEEAIFWARAAGNHTLHLGGGLGAKQDSLFEFKAGFSPLRARFETWRIVCDRARYAALAPAEAAAADYFPAYRRAA
jgi:hypothetical protein